jgi:hypothetical protein
MENLDASPEVTLVHRPSQGREDAKPSRARLLPPDGSLDPRPLTELRVRNRTDNRKLWP